MCLAAFGGDQALAGRKKKFANYFFSEMSSIRHI